MRRRSLAAAVAFVPALGLLLYFVRLHSPLVPEYSPRRSFFLANPLLLWTNVLCDILIIFSYAILVAACVLLIHRLKQLPHFRTHLWVGAAFMTFLVCSSVTTLLRVFSLWWPIYQFSLIFKVICAGAILPAASFVSFRTPAFAASVLQFFQVLLLTQQQGETLRKSEEFLDRTNRLAGIGGWEVKFPSEEVTWSAETCRIHGAARGYHPTLAEGLSMYAPSARPTIIAAVQLASAGGPGWDLELPVMRFDGRKIWARTVGEAEIQNGKVLRLSGAFQDVTAQVEARDALRRANERVALAADSGGIGIWHWDLAEGVLHCDAWMYRLHGKDPNRQKLKTELWRDHLHPDDKDRVEQALEAAIHGTREYDTEFRIIWEDGSVHTLRGAARVTRDAGGQALSMVGANWDVTESRELLAQLAEQHERLRVTLNSIGDGVITTDARGGVTWLNPVAEGLTGWSTSEALSRPLHQVFQPLLPQEDQALTEASSPASRDPLQQSKKEATLLARNGVEYGIESSIAPIRSEPGDLLGKVLVFRDVTEKRRLATQAEDASKLQLKLKDEFISHVSHELRSPLNSIYSFTSIVADKLAGETNAQQDEYLTIVLKNVEQLQSMIEDLLTVTKSREGKLSVRPESVMPHDAVVDALQTLQGAAAKKSIKLSVNHPDHLPQVYADPVRLRQVLIILLDNAIKFTPLAGNVSVEVSSQDSDFLLIQVSDTGCGVPEEKRELIFEHLYQVTEDSQSDTSQAGRTGLGLGLHIARNLVHRQGGIIWVSAAPEEGSIFNFTLPTYSNQDKQQLEPGVVPRRRKTDAAEDRHSSLPKDQICRSFIGTQP